MQYTVIGLLDNTTQPPELTVAGVIAGVVDLVDNDDNDEEAQRWASAVEAADPQHAEEIARDLVAAED